MSTTPRLKSALIWVSACRTVAVEATIFGRIVFPSFCIAQSSSIADSYKPDHGSQRTGNQVKLILNDQVRWLQAINRHFVAERRIAWSIESLLVVPFNAAEERSHIPSPGQGRKLVHRCDHEARQTAIDWLIYRDDRKRNAPAELAIAVHAGNAEVSGMVAVRL